MATTTEKPQDTNGHTSFIKDLEKKLKEAENKLKEISVNAENSQKEYNEKSSEVNTLKDDWESIAITNKLAKSVIEVLSGHLNLAKRASGNASLTNDAVKRLAVNAENIAYDINELDDSMSKLLQSIADNMDPKPDPKSPIMEAINKLAAAISEALAAALDSINKMLEVVQCSEVLEKYLGDQEGNIGLTKSLSELLKLISISDDPKSKIKFPREDCPNDYYEVTEKEYNEAKTKLEELFEQLGKNKEEKALAQAQKDAVSKSKQAAEAASAC